MYILLTGPFVYVISKILDRDIIFCLAGVWPVMTSKRLYIESNLISTYCVTRYDLHPRIRTEFPKWLQLLHMSYSTKLSFYRMDERKAFVKLHDFLKTTKNHVNVRHSSWRFLDKLNLEYYRAKATKSQICNEFPVAAGLKHNFVPWYVHYDKRKRINLELLFNKFINDMPMEIEAVEDAFVLFKTK